MSEPSFEALTYTVENQVVLITLNRPEMLNALNQQLRGDLLAALQLAGEDTDISTIVLTGSGKAFCVGQDLADSVALGEAIRRLIEEEYKPVLLAISESKKLVIAAVNGPAAGGGAALVLACDLMIMADDAYLYQAFIAIGLIPDCGATWQLVHQLGYRRALEVVIEGSKLSAQQCVDWGLANRIAPAAELIPEALQWAEQLSQKAPMAVRYSKQALKFAQNSTLAETISHEAELQGLVSASADAKEGIEAFLQKRKPVFTGQ